MLELFIFCYIFISIVIIISDIRKIIAQENYLKNFPIGDINTYVRRKPILGIHSIIFLPSYLIILCVHAIINLINDIFFY